MLVLITLDIGRWDLCNFFSKTLVLHRTIYVYCAKGMGFALHGHSCQQCSSCWMAGWILENYLTVNMFTCMLQGLPVTLPVILHIYPNYVSDVLLVQPESLNHGGGTMVALSRGGWKYTCFSMATDCWHQSVLKTLFILLLYLFQGTGYRRWITQCVQNNRGSARWIWYSATATVWRWVMLYCDVHFDNKSELQTCTELTFYQIETVQLWHLTRSRLYRYDISPDQGCTDMTYHQIQAVQTWHITRPRLFKPNKSPD